MGADLSLYTFSPQSMPFLGLGLCEKSRPCQSLISSGVVLPAPIVCFCSLCFQLWRERLLRRVNSTSSRGYGEVWQTRGPLGGAQTESSTPCQQN